MEVLQLQVTQAKILILPRGREGGGLKNANRVDKNNVPKGGKEEGGEGG